MDHCSCHGTASLGQLRGKDSKQERVTGLESYKRGFSFMNKFFSGLSIVAVALSLLGCAHAVSPVAPTPVDTHVVVPEPVVAHKGTTGTIENESWKITLPDGWHTVVMKNSKVALMVQSTESYGGFPAVLTIVSTNNVSDERSFIMNAVQSLQDSDDVNILKGQLTMVGEHKAVLLLTLRMLPKGIAVGTVELITSDGDKGYMISCAGDPDEAETFGPLCMKALQTFTMK